MRHPAVDARRRPTRPRSPTIRARHATPRCGGASRTPPPVRTHSRNVTWWGRRDDRPVGVTHRNPAPESTEETVGGAPADHPELAPALLPLAHEGSRCELRHGADRAPRPDADLQVTRSRSTARALDAEAVVHLVARLVV